MKKILALLIALTMVFSLCTVAFADEDPYADFKPVTLRIGHSHSEGEIPHKEMVNMAEKINERTNGKVTVEIYASNTLGSNEDVLEQCRLGSNVAQYCDPGRLDTYAPGVSAISAAYVIEGYDDIAALMDCPTVQGWMDTMEKDYGLTVLGWNWCQGFRNIFATKGGTKPDDFKGVLLRAATSPSWVATVKALGATPVALEFGEMYSGIQTHVCDGCEQNYGSVYNNAIYEVINTITETRHVFLANCVVISSAWLRALPEEFQQIIFEECQAAGERTSQQLAELDDFYRDEMIKYGIEFIPYEDLDIDAFKSNAEAVYETLGITDAVNSLKADLGK